MDRIETEHGPFLARYDTEGNMIQTAEEYYSEWLANKDKQIDICPTPPPTNEELNNQLIETQKLCLSLQKQILLK